MNKTRILIIIVVVFVILLAAAYFLYGDLSEKHSPDNLVTQDTPQNNGDESSNEQEENTADTPSDDKDTANDEDKSDNITPEIYPAPGFTVYDGNGNSVSLSDFIGKPVVINFWSSKCGPCKNEMPAFDALYKELGQEIVFMMINVTDGYWDTLESAKSFIAGQPYSFPVFYDSDQNASSAYGASYSLPQTFLINPEGHLVAYAAGAIDESTLRRGIEMIMSGTSE